MTKAKAEDCSTYERLVLWAKANVQYPVPYLRKCTVESFLNAPAYSGRPYLLFHHHYLRKLYIDHSILTWDNFDATSQLPFAFASSSSRWPCVASSHLTSPEPPACLVRWPLDECRLSSDYPAATCRTQATGLRSRKRNDRVKIRGLVVVKDVRL